MTTTVIAIDGPAASGKGTIAAGVANDLGFRYLDSGSLYRLVALNALRNGIPLHDEAALADAADSLDVEFAHGGVSLDGEDATDDIRSETVSAAASQVAVHPAVRRALLSRQRAFRQPPGLVAEGRDMGTVVFPDAAVKVFVTASVEERAKRRAYACASTRGIQMLKYIHKAAQRPVARRWLSAITGLTLAAAVTVPAPVTGPPSITTTPTVPVPGGPPSINEQREPGGPEKAYYSTLMARLLADRGLR